MAQIAPVTAPASAPVPAPPGPEAFEANLAQARDAVPADGAADTQNFLSFQDPRQGWFRDAKEKFADHVRSAEAVEGAAGLPRGVDKNPEGVARASGQTQKWDGAGDALKHVYLSATMAYSDPATMEQLQLKEGIQFFDGDQHGRNGWDNAMASSMDAHNNRVGFQIGLEARERGLTGKEARDFIINETISRMEQGSAMSDNKLAGLDFGKPYWRFNHGAASLDQASPQWREKFRDAAENNWKF